MMTTIYHENHQALEAVVGRLEGIRRGRSYRFASPGRMDLVVERIDDREISLAHYYLQNGDLCQDPEIVVEVGDGTIEALYFQMAWPPCFQEVYLGFNRDLVDLRAKRRLNDFLKVWLGTLGTDGYELADPESVPSWKRMAS